jgi:hypothetical protein
VTGLDNKLRRKELHSLVCVSTPFSVEDKNEWSNTYIALYVFVVSCSITRKINVSLPCTCLCSSLWLAILTVTGNEIIRTRQPSREQPTRPSVSVLYVPKIWNSQANFNKTRGITQVQQRDQYFMGGENKLIPRAMLAREVLGKHPVLLSSRTPNIKIIRLFWNK